jgi:signal recognition particle receptor subunit beta
MDYARTDPQADPPPLPTAIKILIAGGFGVGKTTMIGAISEQAPLRTEEVLTEEGVGIDDLSGVEAKTTTTVVMDFGRITVPGDLVVYLFGTPGQDRFWFVWDELAVGALGAVVLVDTRRLAACFPSIDYFERHGTPFVVAVNRFQGSREYRLDEVRHALNLSRDVPVVHCDARCRKSGRAVLVTLLEHAQQTNMRFRAAGRDHH